MKEEMYKDLRLFIVLGLLLIAGQGLTQNIGIGTSTPHSSTILDIQSTNKGISLPSMTTTQRNAIVNPKTGLLVFDLDKNTIYMFDGGQWLALLFTATSTTIPPIVRLASDGSIGDQFGWSSSMSGNYAIVGAPYDNTGANANQGCAYIFFRNGSNWAEQAKLTANDGAAGDLFGYSVSISGNYAIIGAYGDGLIAGSAYIFIRSGTTWTQQAKLLPSNPGAGNRFGFSVGMSGDYVVIGAPYDDIGANNEEGSAYFFNRSGTIWTQQDNVVAPSGAANDHFGCSVAISEDYAVIGANEDDVGTNSNQGSAHVFLRNGTNWGYQFHLTGSSSPDTQFGYSVAIEGNYIVAGSPYSSSYAGSISYIFIRNGVSWTQQTILLANPVVFTTGANRFGISVSISGDYVLIGASYAEIEENANQGAAYLFKRDGTGWIFVRRIDDSSGGPDYLMGISTGISGLNCIVGASSADVLKGKVVFLNIE